MGWYVAVMVALLTCRGQGLLLHRSLTQQVLTVTSYYLQVTTCNILLESHYGAADGELPREPRDEWSSSEHSLRQQQQSGEHRLQYYNPTEEALHMHHQQSQGEKPHSLEFLGVRREEDLDEYLHQGPHSQHHHHQSQHQPYHHHHHHLQHLRSSRPSEPHHQNHQQRRDKRNHHRVEKRHQLLQHRLTHHQRLPHPLQFTQSEYRQTVPEDVPLHTSILTVRARSGQNEGDSDIKYQLSDSTNFGIDEGGVIYNLRNLDFEHTNGHYLLQVTAQDLAGRWGMNTAVVSANIQVTDSPEEPYFDSPHYYFSVSEFAPRGSYVGTVTAEDDDEDLDYYFLEAVEPPDMFTVHGVSGVVTLGRTPGKSQWSYTFRAGAVDHRGQVTFVPVTVHIIASNPSYARLVFVANDDNVHKPMFPECNAYDGIRVNENVTAGTPVLLVRAIDQDSGPEGVIKYSLINDFGSFAIHASNQHGQITTTRRLDRDGDDKEFFLTVIARDGALEPLQDTCTFRVVVEDVNDNSPIFDQQRYEQSLATDHSPATPILRVTASDLDSGSNGQVTYHLEGHRDHLQYFAVEPITGVITLKRTLDEAVTREKTVEMRVRAVDSGNPALWSTAPVTIKLVSSGELPPSVVKQEPLRPAILENTTENTEVAILCARSNLPDSTNVYFTLPNGNTRDSNSDGTFAIRRLPEERGVCGDSVGVAIFVATRNLDYETVQAYKLNLQIVNDRNARMEEEVIVDILDVNDNAPLLQAFDGAVLENTDRSLITTIKAVDKDASPQFRQLIYSFDVTATAEVQERFELKPNGELWTSQPLDREEQRQYRVPIQVTDGIPDHERMTIYWISVLDLNDVAPVLERTLGVYEVQLPENREVGERTGIRLQVYDPDVVNNITYAIVEGNEEQKFRVDSIGDVLVNKLLDYDHPVFDRNFTMRVRVSDGRNEPAETDITIAVANVNDLQPVFEHSNYTFSVTENTDCSVVLGKVSALDPDLPSTANQNILYYLSPAELRNFSIGDRSGQLIMKGCLDREAAIRGTITLYPRANDEGGKGHDADPATVHVIINDLNDNYPHFLRPAHSYARILENMEPHLVESVIIELGDLDSEVNGCPCSLEFHAGTPTSVLETFNLTPMEGSRYRLRPITVLDREQQKVYRLPFTARDSRGLAGTRYLTIEVGDENDSPMTDGANTIKVYNYQGQFPAMVVGAVYVTDDDDHDRQDKTFEVDASTSPEVASHFKVDLYTGNITMLKGTPAGTHVLRVKVHDNFRREMAIGQTTISVVDLTLSAVMQSGSLRLANTTSHTMLLQRQPSALGTSLYERLKKQIARIHGIPEAQVDVFALKDVEGVGVDVRYNCHGSPYYTAARLDGVMLRRRRQVSEALGVDIPLVDINLCLYEVTSPCGTKSCQHTMRPNLTSPLVISSDTATVVGVDIDDDYACDCGALEPLPSVCFSGFCYNGGTCSVKNNTLTCSCLDGSNYGPRCELLTARFERGFAWYEPLTVCEHSFLSVIFETNDESGVLLYTGPTVLSPWPLYPRDFLYVVLQGWVVETFLDLGTGTLNISIPIEPCTDQAFEYTISWNEGSITVEIINCGINATMDTVDPCKKTVPLARLSGTPSHLLNVQGPLQIGGVAAMVSFPQLATSYGWTMVPPAIYPFSGCVLEVRHNDYIYDLNATDFSKQTFQPCDAPRTSRVVLGQQSIIIILASLLCLLLLVIVILCLARRGRKSISYPDLDRELVKETMGGTDVEGFGEKDVTHFDLKFLQVTPDGYLVGDENEGALPDVAQDACQRLTAPLAEMPEGLSIGDFIKENIVKVDQQHQDVDDVRHYNAQGDEMSAASLSSLASGSSRSEVLYDYRNDWGQRFEKLAQIYAPESDAEEDSEYEFPDIPSQPRSHFLSPESAKTHKNEPQLSSPDSQRKCESPSAPATERNTSGSSPTSSDMNSTASTTTNDQGKSGESTAPVVNDRSKSKSPVSSPTTKVKIDSPTSSLQVARKTDSPSSSSLTNKHKTDSPSSSPLTNRHKTGSPSSSPLTNKHKTDSPTSSPLTNRHKTDSPTSSPLTNRPNKVDTPPSPLLANKHKIDSPSSYLSRKQNIEPPSSPLHNKQSSKPPTSPLANTDNKGQPLSSIVSRYSNDSSVTTISNLYKSPAQRSLEANRNKTLPKSFSKKPKETTANGAVTSTLGRTRTPGLKTGQDAPDSRKKDYHEAVNPMATVRPGKGIETWC